MIRKIKSQDINIILDIWLNSSIDAHDFIDSNYWIDKKEDMRNIYLPSANVYVYEENKIITGFIAIIDNYIAALFVDLNYQGKVYGTKLLNYAKSLSNDLILAVYAENKKSVKFYRHQKFTIVETRECKNTGHIEYFMKYKQKPPSV